MSDATTTESTFLDQLRSHKNKTVREMWSKVEEAAGPLSEIQAKVKAASPPSVAELDKELSESDKPEIVEFREQIKRLEDALRNAREDAHRELLKGYQTLSDEEIEALNTEYAKQANTVRKALGMVRDYGEIMGVDGVTALVDQYRIPNLRGGSTKGKTNVGDGGPRPKVEKVTIKRADGQIKEDTRISVIAPWAKLTTKDIYAAWFAKAGTDQWQTITETHDFEVKDSNGNDCLVTIVPQSEE